MNLATEVLAPAGAWSAWNVAMATGASCLPLSWFARPGPSSGRPARRPDGTLRVRRWKRLLPDAGAVLPGASPKRHLRHHDAASLARYAVEARRSEVVHWSSVAFVGFCLAWWPFVVVGPMLVVAILINVPCVLALRDSRLRIEAILARSSRRCSTRVVDAPAAARRAPPDAGVPTRSADASGPSPAGTAGAWPATSSSPG